MPRFVRRLSFSHCKCVISTARSARGPRPPPQHGLAQPRLSGNRSNRVPATLRDQRIADCRSWSSLNEDFEVLRSGTFRRFEPATRCPSIRRRFIHRVRLSAQRRGEPFCSPFLIQPLDAALDQNGFITRTTSHRLLSDQAWVLRPATDRITRIDELSLFCRPRHRNMATHAAPDIGRVMPWRTCAQAQRCVEQAGMNASHA